MKKTSTMGVKLDEKTRERLKSLGSLRDRSPHYLMRQAIHEFLDREEKIEQERQLTLERWARYETTGESIDHDAVAAWLDSLGTDEEKPCPIPGN
jgi:predicted transcriptional regulator